MGKGFSRAGMLARTENGDCLSGMTQVTEMTDDSRQSSAATMVVAPFL